jgi:hypothetical protein
MCNRDLPRASLPPQYFFASSPVVAPLGSELLTVWTFPELLTEIAPHPTVLVPLQMLMPVLRLRDRWCCCRYFFACPGFSEPMILPRFRLMILLLLTLNVCIIEVIDSHGRAYRTKGREMDKYPCTQWLGVSRENINKKRNTKENSRDHHFLVVKLVPGRTLSSTFVKFCFALLSTALHRMLLLVASSENW